MEIALAIVGTVIGIVCWFYARHAHKTSLRAPVLRLHIINPDTRERLPSSLGFKTAVQISAALEKPYDEYTKEEQECISSVQGLVVSNVGNATARDVRLKGSYPVFMGARAKDGGKHSEDPMRPQMDSFEFSLGNLHPSESVVWEGVCLFPTREFFEGIKGNTTVKFQDGTAKVGYTAEIKCKVEYLVYCEDQPPQLYEITIAPGTSDSEQDGGGQAATRAESV